MSDAKHTPGPWAIACKRPGETITAIGPCVAEEYAGSSWLEVRDADARLIAAAPDLLATLKAVLAHVEDDTVERTNGQCTLCFSYRQMIRATIAKAEGLS